MAVLMGLNRELTQSGEPITTQGVAAPHEAKAVRGLKDRVPVTDGIFPESKEFLLGYWIIDVATPERAYEICRPDFRRAGAGPDTDQHAD